MDPAELVQVQILAKHKQWARSSACAMRLQVSRFCKQHQHWAVDGVNGQS
jgi:hypothetical protein